MGIINRNQHSISRTATRILSAWTSQDTAVLNTELARASDVCRYYPCLTTREQEELEVLDSVVGYLSSNGVRAHARSRAAENLLRALA